MPISRFIPTLLILLLFAWPGASPSAHASGRGVLSAPSAGASATAAAAAISTSKAGTAAGTDAKQGRKVHGSSPLPASVSFGEVVNAWDVFQAAGYAVDFVSPDGGAVPILDSYVSKDMEPRLQDTRIMDGLRNTATPDRIDPDRYRAVYYVGGSNAMYGVAEDRRLQAIAMHVYERNGGVVLAVCHGTAGIVNLKLGNGQSLLAGKRITGFPEEHEDRDAAYFKQFPFLIRETVQARGGIFRAVDSEAPYIEADQRVLTGQNYASATPLAQAVVDLLRTQAGPATNNAASN